MSKFILITEEEHISTESSCAIISPWVDHCTEEENKRRMACLKEDVRKLYGFQELLCRWKAEEKQQEIRCLLIPKIDKAVAIRLGADYEQESVLWWNGVEFEELCSLANQ